MANNLASNVTEKLLRKFGPAFFGHLVLCKTIDTQLISDAFDPESGDTVSIKRPHQYQAIETADGNLTSSSPSNIISGKATAVVQNMITVWIKWTQIEEALESGDWNKIIMPARDTMVTRLEANLAAYMRKNCGLSLGTIGTAIDAWSDISQVGALGTDIGYSGQMMAALDPWSVTNLADLQKGLGTNDALAKSAWEKAQISGPFANVTPYVSNALSTQTIGTATGTGAVDGTFTVTYTALKDTYTLTLNIDGFAAGATIKAGQQLKFAQTYLLNRQTKERLVRNGAAVPFIGTVKADITADGTGLFTGIVISGAPIYDATNPQYNTVHKAIANNDTVEVLGTASATYKPSLFYAKEAFGMTMIKLPKLQGWDSSVLTNEGFSMRATMSSDPTTGVQAMRLDMMPAFATFDPFLAGQLAGN